MLRLAVLGLALFSLRADARDLAIWKFKSNAENTEQKNLFDDMVRVFTQKHLASKSVFVIDKEQMTKDLAALSLDGDCLEHACTLARAKAIGAEWLLKGDILVDGDNWGLEISLYDTKTGQRLGHEAFQNESYGSALVIVLEKTKRLLDTLPLTDSPNPEPIAQKSSKPEASDDVKPAPSDDVKPAPSEEKKAEPIIEQKDDSPPLTPLIEERSDTASKPVGAEKKTTDPVESAALREALLSGSWQALREHIAAYPEEKQTNVARDALLKQIAESRDLKAIVDVYPLFSAPDSPNHEQAMDLLHALFTDDLEVETTRLFYDTFKAKSLQKHRARDFELSRMVDGIRNNNDRRRFIQKAAPHQRAFFELQRLIRDDLRSKDHRNALSTVRSFKDQFGNSSDYLELNELLEADKDVEINLKTIDSGKTAKRGMSFFPVPTADGKKLYFTGSQRMDNIGGEDIYVISKEGKNWGKTRISRSLSSAQDNDSVLSLSTDGNTMLVFNNGTIYKRERTGNDWGGLVRAGSALNSAGWQSDAVISSDGQTILFSSPRDDAQNMPRMRNGKNSPGWVTLRDPNKVVVQADLYVSHRNDNGEWGEPINMGPQLNTPYFERSPFLHPDMKTLYFSSDGHGGLGGLDVWMTKRLRDDCWDCWSPPVNMGKEINGPDSDMGYKISTDGKTAYFSKADKNGQGVGLFSLVLPPRLRPDLVSQLSGSLKNRNNQPVSATIRWEDLDTGEVIGESKSNPEDGSYFIVLPMGKMYGYYVDDGDLFPTAKSIDLRDEKKAVTKVEEIEVVTIKEMVDEGIAAPLNNLFFETSKFELLGFSKNELERVAKIIKRNDLSVEIGGHTDDLGPAEKNKQLSMERALSVRDFLIEKGVSIDKLYPVGHGESRPISPNNTKENRAKNRRVELSFLSTEQADAAKKQKKYTPIPYKPKPLKPTSSTTKKPTDVKKEQPLGKLPINTVLKLKENYRYGYMISGYSQAGDPEFVFFLNGKARPDKPLNAAMLKEAKKLWKRRTAN